MKKIKKKNGRNFLHFWMPIIPKTHLIKALNSLVSLRPNGRLSQNPKQEVLGNNFYLKMISKLTLQKFLMPTDAKKDVKLRPRSLSNPLTKLAQ